MPDPICAGEPHAPGHIGESTHDLAVDETPGATAARFVFWYAFLRVFIDLFRDYPTHRLALGTGQTLNLIMVSIGVVFLIRSRIRRRAPWM